MFNEAEITLPLFLADLAQNCPNLLYCSDKFADVQQSPIRSFHLIDMNDYLYGIDQSSRGRPFMCDFCDITYL